MPQEKEDTKCSKCGKDAKEAVMIQVDLLDFGGGPTVQVIPIKKEVKCSRYNE